MSSLLGFVSVLQDIAGPPPQEGTQVTKSAPQLTIPIPEIVSPQHQSAASAPTPRSSSPGVDIAILCFPGVQATSVHGLTDLFAYAEHFARAHASSAGPFLRVSHWRQDASAGELLCEVAGRPVTGIIPAIVILPATQIGPVERGYAAPSTAWVRRMHANGAVVAAVCGGVFLLADTGLLSGRRATTHWLFAEELGRRFPDTAINADRLVIDDGDLVTAGGVLAWVDLGLCLVERLLGSTVMASTARFMLAEPPGREQRYYSVFNPRMQHGDKPIVALQHWLHAHVDVACSVESLARRAGLGQRTLLRRFVKATGLTPGEYHQRVKIARARELLEFTRDTVDQIAAATGYGDSGGFRKSFKRVVGLSPAEFRRRFAMSRPAAPSVPVTASR
jgi:transcriptional regulator GlxA family with amidase domain